MAISARFQFAFPFQALLATLIVLFSPLDQMNAASKRVMVRHYSFNFDAKMPLSALLPMPPFDEATLPPATNTDLTKVPELTFGELIVRKDESTEKAMARVLAKINHVSKDVREGFMKALIVNRPDLAGLPFRMGKDCETELKQAVFFNGMVRFIHENRFQANTSSLLSSKPKQMPNPKFWEQFREMVKSPNRGDPDPLYDKHINIADRAAVAAVMQVFGPSSADDRINMARFLATVRIPDAGQALAKLAIFAPEPSVHQAAIYGLASHASSGYEQILIDGFRYPHPSVAKRAAEALVKTKNKTVLRDLVKVLEQPDPRAPVQVEERLVVRELVRVNHHRNCLLCHAPANVKGVPAGVLTVAVPLPDEELPRPSEGGYRFRSSPDIFVRTDVTYLRQDFSMMMKVHDAKPWPEMQRFDFSVNTRTVTPEEAAMRTKELAHEPSPYHEAARYALRELTGRQPADSSPVVWRRVIASRQ
jgi:hypothetical protein